MGKVIKCLGVNDEKLLTNKRAVEWPVALMLLAYQLSPLLIFLVAIPRWCWLVCIGFVIFRLGFVSIGYHRYFSHRVFKTSRWFQFLMAVGATLSYQGGLLRWSSIHRLHHKNSDTPEDMHSPVVYGFWEAHVLWIIRKYDVDDSNIKDLTKYPELVLLEKLWMLPAMMIGVLFFYIGGWPLLLVGYFVSTMVLYNLTWTINSIDHIWGSSRFPSKDNSKNNLLFALFTFGDGWHNNHHYYPNSARHGFYWYELDLSYYIICLLEKVGLVWDVKGVPKHILEKGRTSQEVKLKSMKLKSRG